MNSTIQFWQAASNYSFVEITTYYSEFAEYTSWDEHRQVIRAVFRIFCGVLGLIGYLFEVLVLTVRY